VQVQELKEIEDVMRKINIEGCIPAIQAFIERNLYTVGGIAIAIALSQVPVLKINNIKEQKLSQFLVFYKCKKGESRYHLLVNRRLHFLLPICSYL
jgi:hypothetical protein